MLCKLEVPRGNGEDAVTKGKEEETIETRKEGDDDHDDVTQWIAVRCWIKCDLEGRPLEPYEFGGICDPRRLSQKFQGERVQMTRPNAILDEAPVSGKRKEPAGDTHNKDHECMKDRDDAIRRLSFLSDERKEFELGAKGNQLLYEFGANPRNTVVNKILPSTDRVKDHANQPIQHTKPWTHVR